MFTDSFGSIPKIASLSVTSPASLPVWSNSFTFAMLTDFPFLYYLAALTADLMMIRDFLAPGTLPLIRITFFSGTT